VSFGLEHCLIGRRFRAESCCRVEGRYGGVMNIVVLCQTNITGNAIEDPRFTDQDDLRRGMRSVVIEDSFH
jgi:hypothetical protein